MLKTMTFVLATMAALLNAQELLPELSEPAAKHKAADEALDKQKLEAVALAAKAYVSALDGIEKSATAAGQVALIAAVVKERDAAIAGSLEPELPSALPKAKLQTTRKALLMKLEQLNADIARKKQQLVAEHLRQLAALQPKAASNTELAKQLAAEKAALLSNGGAASGNGATAANKPRGKNAVVNGNFEKIADGKPEGWTLPECATVETENKNTFVRIASPVRSDGTSGYYSFRQELDLPKGAIAVSISLRIRTKDGTDGKWPGAQVGFVNQDGKFFNCASVFGNGKKGSWQKIQVEMDIPKTTVTTFVELLNGQCPRQIDFDDVEVTFK